MDMVIVLPYGYVYHPYHSHCTQYSDFSLIYNPKCIQLIFLTTSKYSLYYVTRASGSLSNDRPKINTEYILLLTVYHEMEYFRISKFRAGYSCFPSMTHNSVSTKYTPNEMNLQFANKICPIVNLFSFSIIILGKYRIIIVSIHQHNFIDVLFDDKKKIVHIPWV